MRPQPQPSRRRPDRALGIAIALFVAVGCSSGEQGPLVDCVVPGAVCCADQACAIGLACDQNNVCVLLEAGAPAEGGLVDADAPESGVADAPSSE
jgi:hypothetical protein